LHERFLRGASAPAGARPAGCTTTAGAFRAGATFAILRGVDVRRLLLVAHPAERMFDLIEGAEHYPAFLPWCAGATILERSEAVVAARLVVAVRGVRFTIATRNRKRRPGWMGLALDDGPFSVFDGEWQLTGLGSDGCKVEFALRYDFDNAALRAIAGPVFERVTSTLVDAFVSRADALGERIPTLYDVVPAPLDAAAASPARPDPTAAT
jgi:ribosome-associated toxin RatA of RatAB toxin-antitoxin module